MVGYITGVSEQYERVDDYATVQQAIDSANAKGKDVWFTPNATYTIEEPLVMYDGQILSGNNATITNGTAQWFAAFNPLSVDGVTVEEFVIDGDFSEGVLVQGCDDITIHRNTIRNIGRQEVAPNEEGLGIGCYGNSQTLNKNLKVSENIIENTKGWGGTRGDAIYVTYYENSIVRDNIIDGTQRQGISFTDGCKQFLCVNNVIQNVALAGIDVEPNAGQPTSINAILGQNMVVGYGSKPAGQIGGQYNGLCLNRGVENTAVIGNVILDQSGINYGDESAEPAAVYVKAESESISLVGNVIRGAEKGINCNQGNPKSMNLSVTGNTFADISIYGLEFNANPAVCVTGNVMENVTDSLVAGASIPFAGNVITTADIRTGAEPLFVGNKLDDLYYNNSVSSYGMVHNNQWDSEPRVRGGGILGVSEKSNYNLSIRRMQQRMPDLWTYCKFNGIDQWIELPPFDPDITSDRTLTFWVYLFGDTHGLWTNTTGNQPRTGGKVAAGEWIAGTYNGSSYQLADKYTNVPQEKWIFCTYYQFVNGTRSVVIDLTSGTVPITSTVFPFENQVRLGRLADDYLNGYMRDFRVYNRLLSNAEQIAITHGAGSTDGLIHHWPLEADFEDKVGALNGTPNGALTFEQGITPELHDVGASEVELYG